VTLVETTANCADTPTRQTGWFHPDVPIAFIWKLASWEIALFKRARTL
jgi:hypothetical protein